MSKARASDKEVRKKSLDNITGWSEEDNQLSSTFNAYIQAQQTSPPVSRQNSIKDLIDASPTPKSAAKKAASVVKPGLKPKLEEPGPSSEQANSEEEDKFLREQKEADESPAALAAPDNVEQEEAGSAPAEEPAEGEDVCVASEINVPGDEDSFLLESTLNTTEQSLLLDKSALLNETQETEVVSPEVEAIATLQHPLSCEETLNALRRIRPNPKVKPDELLSPAATSLMHLVKPLTPDFEACSEDLGHGRQITSSQSERPARRRAMPNSRASSPKFQFDSPASTLSDLQRSFSHQGVGRDKGGCCNKLFVNTPSNKGGKSGAHKLRKSIRGSDELILYPDEKSALGGLFQRPATVSGPRRRLASAQQHSLNASLAATQGQHETQWSATAKSRMDFNSHTRTIDSKPDPKRSMTPQPRRARTADPIRARTPDPVGNQRQVRTPADRPARMPSRHSVRNITDLEIASPSMSLQIHMEIARRMRSGRRTNPQAAIFQPLFLSRPETPQSHLKYTPGKQNKATAPNNRRNTNTSLSSRESSANVFYIDDDEEDQAEEHHHTARRKLMQTAAPEIELQLDLMSWMGPSVEGSEFGSPSVRSVQSPLPQRKEMLEPLPSVAAEEFHSSEEHRQGYINIHNLEHLVHDYGNSQTFACNVVRRRSETVKLTRCIKS